MGKKTSVINHDPFAELDAADIPEPDSGDEPAVQAHESLGQEHEMALSTAQPEAAAVEQLQPLTEQAETDAGKAEQNNEGSDMTGQTEQAAQEGVDANWTDVQLGPSLTITDAESRKIELNNLLADGLPVRFNAEDIDQVDGAGMQLLAAFFVQARQQGLSTGWMEVSPVLLDAARLLGLDELLELPGDTAPDDGEGTAWGLF